MCAKIKYFAELSLYTNRTKKESACRILDSNWEIDFYKKVTNIFCHWCFIDLREEICFIRYRRPMNLKKRFDRQLNTLSLTRFGNKQPLYITGITHQNDWYKNFRKYYRILVSLIYLCYDIRTNKSSIKLYFIRSEIGLCFCLSLIIFLKRYGFINNINR